MVVFGYRGVICTPRQNDAVTSNYKCKGGFGIGQWVDTGRILRDGIERSSTTLDRPVTERAIIILSEKIHKDTGNMT